ncbi:MAG: hypothetical protein WCG00_11175 [Hyphomicrobiales bacterium]|nr:hypothetical protein [Hyphomicrobiales bacterium]
MSTVPDGLPADERHYSYRPSLMGAPWVFHLTSDGLAWENGRRSGHVLYRDIRRVRLSFKPVSLQTQRYVMEVWASGAPKLQAVSSSWKSMVEHERLDKAYCAFVAELHRRMAEANAPVSFEHGSHPLRYWPGLAIFAAVSLGLAFLILRALQSEAPAGAAFVAAFLGLFIWHGANYFRRNRPGVYTPNALPELLLPKG